MVMVIFCTVMSVYQMVDLFFKKEKKHENTNGGFHKWGSLKWLVSKGNPIKMDDLGVPPFMETAKYPCSVPSDTKAPGANTPGASWTRKLLR